MPEAITLTVGRRRIELSHPDKMLFPKARVTKRELAEYYGAVAHVMLPHVRDRPLALESFPGGVERHGFFLKAVPAHFPDWIRRVEVSKRGGSLTQLTVRDAATLVYLAGQNVITPHIWLSRIDAPRDAIPR